MKHTAKHYFEQLQEPYCSQALANIEGMEDEPIYDNAFRAITEAFDWENSPEGHNYWDAYGVTI
jgi:hypothetical protein